MGDGLGVYVMRTCCDCGRGWPDDQFCRAGGNKCLSCRNAINKRWRQTPSGVAAMERKRWKKHGLTVEEGNGMLWIQDNKCVICDAPDPTHVDHDHAHCPGQFGCAKCVRGILCRRCNTAIGMLDDSPEKSRSAAMYLEDRNVRA